MKLNRKSIGFHEITGISPNYNVKSTLVPCSGTDYVFLYGGFDDLDALDSKVYLFNTKTMIWEIDDNEPNLYREGHLATYIGNGNILVFGGIPYDDFPIPQTTDLNSTLKLDLVMIIYNIFEKKWFGPPKFTLENAPSSRSRHAACLSLDGSKLYISGGLVDSVPLDDLYCYDLSIGIWQGPIQFAPRFDHFLTINGDKLFTLGGLDKDMNHTKDIITWYSLKSGTIGNINILKPSTSEGYTEKLALDSILHGHERIHVNSELNSAIKLTICLPVWSSNSTEFKISYIDLNEYECRTIFNLNDLNTYVKRSFEAPLDITKQSWKKAFVADSGTLFILGSRNGGFSVEEEQIQQDTNLSCILYLKLDCFGIPIEQSVTNDNIKYSCDNTLENSFKKLLMDQLYTDFEIVCDIQNHEKRSIRVHKAVLAARWPHFERMLQSGMVETVLNSLVIPEPYEWVRGLIHYLYTGTIEFNDYLQFEVLDYSGLLILSNMYELPILRSLTLSKVYESFEKFQIMFSPTNSASISTLIKLWQDLTFSNEDVFIIKIIDMLKQHWPVITHSEAFRRLSKEEIVKLCQDCSSEKDIPSKPTSRSSSNSVESIQQFSDIDTPTRNTNSPFLIDSPPNRNLLANSVSLSSLQNLTSVLNDNL